MGGWQVRDFFDAKHGDNSIGERVVDVVKCEIYVSPPQKPLSVADYVSPPKEVNRLTQRRFPQRVPTRYFAPLREALRLTTLLLILSQL